MAIKFRCDNCGKVQSIPDYSGGRTFKCQCGRSLVAPGEKTLVSGWTIVMIVVMAVTLPTILYLVFSGGGEPSQPSVRSEEAEEQAVAPEVPAETNDRSSDSTKKEEAALHVPLPLSILRHSARRGDAGERDNKLPAAQAEAHDRISAGDELYAKGAYADALTQYRSILAAFPGDRVARRRVAASLYNMQDYEAALAEVREVIAADPGDADSHYLLGCICRRLRDYATARAELRAAVELAPAHLPASHELAAVLRAMGDEQLAITHWYEAIAACRKLLQDAPRDAELHLELGKMLAEVGNQAEAQQHALTAKALGHKDADELLRKLQGAAKGDQASGPEP